MDSAANCTISKCSQTSDKHFTVFTEIIYLTQKQQRLHNYIRRLRSDTKLTWPVFCWHLYYQNIPRTAIVGVYSSVSRYQQSVVWTKAAPDKCLNNNTVQGERLLTHVKLKAARYVLNCTLKPTCGRQHGDPRCQLCTFCMWKY